MSALQLDNGQSRITVLPGLGAGLACYDVSLHGEWMRIFRSVPPSTSHPFALSNILLIPFSGRVSQGGFSFDGVFHEMQRNMETEKYPIHGNAFSSHWQLLERGPERVKLALQSNGPGPFRYEARMTYRLYGRDLHMELWLCNRASIRLPFGAGFHPWFVRDADTWLQARAENVWLEKPDHLPLACDAVQDHPDMNFNKSLKLPTGWINNWFNGWDGQARILWPRRGLAVDIRASSLLNQYVVFSPSTDADFFCFEPVSHPVDAFNLAGGPESHGLQILAPGEEFSCSAIFSPQSLPEDQPVNSPAQD